MFKKVSLIFILFTIAMLSSSCFDANEIDSYAYVTTIGIDQGIADNWRFTFQITNMRSSSQPVERGEKRNLYHKCFWEKGMPVNCQEKVETQSSFSEQPYLMEIRW